MTFARLQPCGSQHFIFVNPRYVVQVTPRTDVEGRKACDLRFQPGGDRSFFGWAPDVARALSGGNIPKEP